MKSWDPFRDLLAIQDRMNKLFESVLTGPVPLDAEREGISYWRPNARVVDQAESFQIECELPGIALEQIDLRIDPGLLTVQGERTRSEVGSSLRFHRLERPHGRFLRRFELPPSLEIDAVRATLENGVLTVTVPKRADAKARSIRVEAQAARDH
jgi:HSP20 family protein